MNCSFRLILNGIDTGLSLPVKSQWSLGKIAHVSFSYMMPRILTKMKNFGKYLRATHHLYFRTSFLRRTVDWIIKTNRVTISWSLRLNESNSSFLFHFSNNFLFNIYGFCDVGTIKGRISNNCFWKSQLLPSCFVRSGVTSGANYMPADTKPYNNILLVFTEQEIDMEKNLWES